MAEIREIGQGELERWTVAMRAVASGTGTVEDYLGWRRQARETVWLLASEGEADVGAAIGVGGWHSPPGVARADIRVVERARGEGLGGALLERLGGWSARLLRPDRRGAGGGRGKPRVGGAAGFCRGGSAVEAHARPDGERHGYRVVPGVVVALGSISVASGALTDAARLVPRAAEVRRRDTSRRGGSQEHP